MSEFFNNTLKDVKLEVDALDLNLISIQTQIIAYRNTTIDEIKKCNKDQQCIQKYVSQLSTIYNLRPAFDEFFKFNDSAFIIATTLKGFRSSVYSELSKAWDNVENKIVTDADGAISKFQLIDADIRNCLQNLP